MNRVSILVSTAMVALGMFVCGAAVGRYATRSENYLVSKTPPVILPAELAMYCGRSGWVMPCRAPGCASKAASDTVTVTVEETWSR